MTPNLKEERSTRCWICYEGARAREWVEHFKQGRTRCKLSGGRARPRVITALSLGGPSVRPLVLEERLQALPDMTRTD